MAALGPYYATPAVLALTGIALLWNRRVRGFLPDDVPSQGRKQHGRRMPLAGVVIVPPILFWLLADHRYVVAIAVAAVAILGFVDDWHKEKGRDFDWRINAAGLGSAAFAIPCTQSSPLEDPMRFLFAWALVFVLTNAINFLDNTDGVAASVAGASLVGATHAEGPLAAAGFAACGFVAWNWPRPLCFLGDCGAYALGLCAGTVCIESLPASSALLPFALPLFDFVQVVTVRLCLGLRPWRGDRRHISHILQNGGLPRWLVAPVLGAVTWWCAGW